MEKNFYDVIIIGAGPAGLNCALYASRANLNVLFIEKGAPGGKMTSTFRIENWIGDEEIKGFELSKRMLAHAKKSGAKYKYGEVIKINPKSEFEHEIVLKNGEKFYSKSLVIATGMINRIPNEIEGIYDFEHKGVSYCVVCDGSFYKNMPAAIIGGGNSAFEEAIYLSSIASIVNIFVRDEKAIADQKIIDEIKEIKNINVFYNSQVVKLKGNDKLESIIVQINGENKEIETNHLYPYIGFLPSNEFAKDLDIFDEKGFIIVDENFETKTKGLYAIGDIVVKQIRQIVTAAADGAIVGKILANRIK